MSTKKYVLFPVKFPAQLKDWINERKDNGLPGSQTAFAEEIVKEWSLNHPDEVCPVNSQYVSDWKTGRQGIPYKFIKEICAVLGVSEDVYTPQTHNEKYQFSSEYITQLGKDHVEFAKKIGLDLGLVEALSKVVDFGQCFPLYSPICHKTVDPKTNEVIYDREVNYMDTASIDKDLSYLQIHRDGKTITMHKCDLAYLKEVQDQLSEFVEYLFYKRAKEMEKETKSFNEDLISEEVMDDGTLHVSYYSPNEEFVLKHDRFAQYSSVAIPKKRKATQEEIDSYFGHGIKKRGQ